MKITDSLFLCLNSADGSIPERIQILPAGKEIKGADGRRWTLSDATAFCSRMNASGHARKWCIDENHSTDLAAPQGRPSPAVGWFSNLTAESDGSIWANVEWNARGKEALSNKEYRFISPVFMCNEKKEITEILRAALTNTPNLANPALNATQDEPAEEKNMDKELCAALGLPETATNDEVLAAVASLKNAGTNGTKNGQVDLAAYAPRADLNAMQERAEKAEKQLAQINAAALKAKATAAVEQAVKDGKIAPRKQG
ncbi:MAG: phage protease [Bacteroides sp.]|nr:phage protease [Prevotella sp.]MCM1407064.1 phage protease [Treponema brennaborense]MCM1470216.1 phage protease [Bacteroides sp.]